MEIEKFIENYREAFGEAAGLPVVFLVFRRRDRAYRKDRRVFF